MRLRAAGLLFAGGILVASGALAQGVPGGPTGTEIPDAAVAYRAGGSGAPATSPVPPPANGGASHPDTGSPVHPAGASVTDEPPAGGPPPQR